MWVRFTGEFWYTVKPGVKIRYKEGKAISIPTAQARLAIAQGKAVETSRPKKEKGDGEPNG